MKIAAIGLAALLLASPAQARCVGTPEWPCWEVACLRRLSGTCFLVAVERATRLREVPARDWCSQVSGRLICADGRGRPR